MLVSGFMNASNAMLSSNPRQVIAACTVHMQMFHARPSKKTAKGHAAGK
jgi:hypothetical protein